MGLTLFNDQTEIMRDLYAEMQVEKSILLQSATGSGKTVMGKKIIFDAVARKRRVLFSVPRRDLMIQTSESFTRDGIRHSFIAAGENFDPFADVYIGMVDTMARRLRWLPNFHLSIFDETHFGADALGSVIGACQKPWIENGVTVNPWTIGLSATPWKMNGTGLGIWYRKMIQGKSIRWLIDNKRLSDYKYFYGMTHLDLKKIKVQGGDYAKGELADFMEHQSGIIGDCVRDYQKRCMGKLHLVRCASTKHSQMIAESFRNAGIPAAHVDGNTPDDIKKQIFMAYARREILVITFCDLLNFGFDLAQATGMDVCIESGSDTKPSMSLAGQMQFWGRMLRYKPYHAIINDHVNNWRQHQLPCTERSWTLLGRQKNEGGEKIPATKQCPLCYFVHSPQPKCPECGHVYVVIGRGVAEHDGELIEMDINAVNNKHKRIMDGLTELGFPFTEEEKTFDYLVRLAKRESIVNPISWATEEFKLRNEKESV